MWARIRDQTDHRRRAVAFQTATILALGITEAAAFLGLLAFDPELNPWPLIGLAGHLLLGFAIWPGPDRFRGWVGDVAD